MVVQGSRKDGFSTQVKFYLFISSLNHSTDIVWVPAMYQHWVGGTERTSPPSLRRLRPPTVGHLVFCPPFSEVSLNCQLHHCPTYSHLTEGEREVIHHPPYLPGQSGLHTCPYRQVLLHFTSCAPFHQQAWLGVPSSFPGYYSLRLPPPRLLSLPGHFLASLSLQPPTKFYLCQVSASGLLYLPCSPPLQSRGNGC